MRKVLLLIVMITSTLLATSCGTNQNVNQSWVTGDVEFGKEDYKKIVAANNQLGMELLANVETNSNGNLFISPTSLFMALSLLYNGADGETKEEIANALQIEAMDADEVNKANASLMTILSNHSEQIQLNVANSIWLNKQYHFREDFSRNNKAYFNAEIKEINVTSSESVKMINDWVEKSTNKKIKEMVNHPMDSDTVAILLNAIYFKGDWKFIFDKKLTEKSDFYLENGDTKDVPLMVLNEKLAYMENDGFQAVSLPYGNGDMSMKVFLPKKDSSLEAFKSMLTNENWEQWSKEFHKKEGTILLPKFQLEYEVSLNDALMKLGLEKAFESADFSKMIEDDVPIWISEVKQKTFIDVYEEGTEAAAVTSIAIVTESATADMPFRMEVNRPFFITITDEKTGTILFMGAIANP